MAQQNQDEGMEQRIVSAISNHVDAQLDAYKQEITAHVDLRLETVTQQITEHVDKRFDAMIKYIDQKVDPIAKVQQQHTETMATHTGYHAEHAVTLKRLDDERLASINRVDRLETDIAQLEEQVAA